jgi:ketosteroid isomerase-like protein
MRTQSSPAVAIETARRFCLVVLLVVLAVAPQGAAVAAAATLAAGAGLAAGPGAAAPTAAAPQVAVVPPVTTPAAAAGGEAARAEAAIRAALQAWVQAFNARDLKGAMAVWAPDLVGWYPGSADSTYANTRESLERAFAPGEKSRTTFSLVIEEVLVAGDMAVVRDRWTQTDVKPGAPKPVIARIKSFEVWRRQADGSWKISRWISAPDPRQP